MSRQGMDADTAETPAGMRAQGEAEIAIEQGETRYKGVTWTARSQSAVNQLIPLPEPARRGLINLADDVIATTNHAVAAAAQFHPSNVNGANKSGREATAGVPPRPARSRAAHDPTPRSPRRCCTGPVRDRLVDVGGLATGRRPACWASRGADTYYHRKEDDDHAAHDCQV